MPASDRFCFSVTDGRDPDFVALCHELDEFLNQLVGGEQNRAEYIPYNALDDIHDVIVVRDGGIPVGCASFKRYDDTCAEIKRVFLREACRGQGVGRELLARLEAMAREKGYRTLILESGEPLKDAMRLYRAAGYRVIPNFGPYADMPASVCMEKRL